MMTMTPQPARPFYLLFLLFLVNFLNFFDRTLPAVVLEPVGREFGLSDTVLGLLGTAFVLVYAVAGVPLGRLADTRRRTRVLTVGVAVWSLFTAATGTAKGLGTLLLMRLGVGVGEASCAPAANSLIADLFPSARRARALGFFMLGLPLGSLLAFAVGGWLAKAYGWRMPFLVAAGPGLLLAGLLGFAREPRRGAADGDTAPPAPVTRPYRHLAGIPTLWWLMLSGAAFNFAAYALNTFLSSLLIRFHGLDIARANGVAAVVLGVTGLVGLGGGGWLADAVRRRGERGRLALGAASVLAGAGLAWLGLSQPAGAVTALALWLGAGWLLNFLYYVTVYPALHAVLPTGLRATGMALFFFFMYVLGGGLGTVATGALSDRFARQAMALAGASALTPALRAQGLQQALLWAVPSALLLAGLAIAWATRSVRRDVERCRP